MTEVTDKKTAGFSIKKVTDLSKVVLGQDDGILPESDLTVQHDNFLIQYQFNRSDEQKKEVVGPGVYSLGVTTMGVVATKMELRDRNLLVGAVNTTRILNEANTFFNKLDVYEQLGRAKKRGVLLYSSPGLGKTSAISHFCKTMVDSDPGTVVINWPTDRVKAADVSSFLSTYTEFSADCTKLILIIEDIGGGNRDYDGDRSVSASLLNMLDGVDFVFRLPTFIIATTNHPENLLGALANRPGRFDLMLELRPPSAEERVELVKFIAKRELTPAEILAISDKKAEDFSIAHLEEVVVRSMIHDKSFSQVIQELVDHANRYKNSFTQKKPSLGFNSDLNTLLENLGDD